MGTYGAIIGKPGIGKSHLCECFAASDPNCIYVSASQGINVKYRPILKLIQQELRGELYLNAHRTTQDLEEEISCSLANDDYWLLIDESQNIDRGVIRTLLGFNDYLRGPNIPVVLIGNPQTLRSQRSDDFALDQIHSRIGSKTLHVTELAWRDVESIAMSNGVEGIKAFEFLENLWENGMDLRGLADILRCTRINIAETGPIDFEMLKAGDRALNGEGIARGHFKRKTVARSASAQRA